MPDVIVRNARKEDVVALLELYHQLDETAELPTIADAVKALDLIHSQPWMRLLVADLNGVVVGTVTLVVVPNVTHKAKPWAQIENVVVREGHRRAGIGHALMARCEQIARETGAYKMQLQSGHKRKEAHSFYQKEGFVPIKVGFSKYL